MKNTNKYYFGLHPHVNSIAAEKGPLSHIVTCEDWQREDVKIEYKSYQERMNRITDESNFTLENITALIKDYVFPSRDRFQGYTQKSNTSLQVTDVKDISVPFKDMSHEDLMTLHASIIGLWTKGDPAEAEEFFGKTYAKNKGIPLVGTLTHDQTQLRLWTEKPGVIRYDHTDSCGRSHPLSLYNEKGIEKEYIDIISEIVAPAHPCFPVKGFEEFKDGFAFSNETEPHRPTHFSCNKGDVEIKYGRKYRRF